MRRIGRYRCRARAKAIYDTRVGGGLSPPRRLAEFWLTSKFLEDVVVIVQRSVVAPDHFHANSVISQ